jgi:exoribonuclease II
MIEGRGPAREVHARPEDVAGRTDFCTLQIVTINGEHARDFDDAISIDTEPPAIASTRSPRHHSRRTRRCLCC